MAGSNALCMTTSFQEMCTAKPRYPWAGIRVLTLSKLCFSNSMSSSKHLVGYFHFVPKKPVSLADLQLTLPKNGTFCPSSEIKFSPQAHLVLLH